MAEILTFTGTATTEVDLKELLAFPSLVEHKEKKTCQPTQQRVYLSIVIPAYNEEKRIPETLRRIVNYINDRKYSSEIIIVDDGSTDHTVKVSREILTQRVPFKVVSNPSNRGKGSAIRKGMLAAKGEYVLFVDADMSTPIEELDVVLPEMYKGYDIVMGSRKMQGARINIHQPKYREVMGRMFSHLSRWMIRSSVSDFTCGFKCFRKACINAIFKRQRLAGWGYDTEIVFIANNLGMKIMEIPVAWSDSTDTKVRLWKDVIGSALDLINIRINSMLGRYNQADALNE